MAQMGVKLVQGDLNDPRSYEAHLQGADGMFLNANCEMRLFHYF